MGFLSNSFSTFETKQITHVPVNDVLRNNFMYYYATYDTRRSSILINDPGFYFSYFPLLGNWCLDFEGVSVFHFHGRYDDQRYQFFLMATHSMSILLRLGFLLQWQTYTCTTSHFFRFLSVSYPKSQDASNGISVGNLRRNYPSLYFSLRTKTEDDRLGETCVLVFPVFHRQSNINSSPNSSRSSPPTRILSFSRSLKWNHWAQIRSISSCLLHLVLKIRWRFGTCQNVHGRFPAHLIKDKARGVLIPNNGAQHLGH